jgi:hypothetical protein
MPIPTVPAGGDEVVVVVGRVVDVVREGFDPPPTRLTSPKITATTSAAVSPAASRRRR